jgi:hypothetical protein
VKNLLLAFAAIALTPAVAGTAHAWFAEICPNGHPLTGLNADKTFQISGCPNLATSAFQAVAIDSADRWNGIWGMADRFQYNVVGHTACAYSIGQDPPVGQWVIFESDNALNDWPLEAGWGGVAVVIYDGCELGGEARAAHIVLRDSVSKSKGSELGTTMIARHTMMHEMGHVLGMEHDVWNASVMHPGGAGPYTARSSGAPGESTWLAETPFATDLRFAFQYHSTNSVGYPDFAMSGWGFDTSTGKARRHYDSGEQLMVCPGETVSVTFSVANLGKISGPAVTYALMASYDNAIDTLDTLVGWGTISEAYAWYTVHTRTFVVPYLSTGEVKAIGVILDHANTIREDHEKNNAGRTGLSIKRKTGCTL